MKKESVLVFGAAGFIGTYLIDELLKQNYAVTASDISKIGEMYYTDNGIPFIAVDITRAGDFEKLANSKFDFVIHLAAQQPANTSARGYDPKKYIQVNVIGTLNILEFCRQNGVKKIIYASSHRNTQSLWADKKAIREEDGRGQKFDGEYAMFSLSESAAQDCVEHYTAEYGLRSVKFRLPPVYGYGPHTEIFKEGKPVMTGFQTFIVSAMEGKPLEMWGDSSVGRDIIYVKDVVSAFIKTLKNDKAKGLYNIASGKYLTLREQVETTAKVFWAGKGKPQIVELSDKPHKMDSFLYDISKAKRELDWSPQYNFEKLLIDYKKEMNNEKFKYLVEKRKLMFKEE